MPRSAFKVLHKLAKTSHFIFDSEYNDQIRLTVLHVGIFSPVSRADINMLQAVLIGVQTITRPTRPSTFDTESQVETNVRFKHILLKGSMIFYLTFRMLQQTSPEV